MDLAELEDWRLSTLTTAPDVQKDVVDPLRLHELSLTLRRNHQGNLYYRLHDGTVDPRAPDPGAVPSRPCLLPPGWQLVLFHSLLHEPQAHTEPSMARDGYEKKWSPLTNTGFTQRMWAGAQCTFNVHNPVLAGQVVEQSTHVSDISLKMTGSRGPMVVVTERRELSNAHGHAMREDRQLAYMKETASASSTTPRRKVATPASADQADFSFKTKPTPVMLFRYSALTFNSHLIHYNHPYTQEVAHLCLESVMGQMRFTLLTVS